jgi:hypothetical protein
MMYGVPSCGPTSALGNAVFTDLCVLPVLGNNVINAAILLVLVTNIFLS